MADPHLHRQLSKMNVVLVDVLCRTLHDKLVQRLTVVGELLGFNLHNRKGAEVGQVLVGEWGCV
jgi:hypothetical protein